MSHPQVTQPSELRSSMLAAMLGLTTPTDNAWVVAAVADMNAVLADHAHCEMKAATNALALVMRYRDRPEFVKILSQIAEEELTHFQQVYDILVARGIPLGPPTVDAYAARLRKSTAAHRPSPPIDRLLVAALIEARSCERFRILSEHAPDAELRRVYGDLLESEASHYRIFVNLAVDEGAREGLGMADVRKRLAELAEIEGVLVSNLADSSSRSTIHG